MFVVTWIVMPPVVHRAKGYFPSLTFRFYAASRTQNKEGYRSGQEQYHFNRKTAATILPYAVRLIE